jgi:hypothetical protein
LKPLASPGTLNALLTHLTQHSSRQRTQHPSPPIEHFEIHQQRPFARGLWRALAGSVVRVPLVVTSCPPSNWAPLTLTNGPSPTSHEIPAGSGPANHRAHESLLPVRWCSQRRISLQQFSRPWARRRGRLRASVLGARDSQRQLTLERPPASRAAGSIDFAGHVGCASKTVILSSRGDSRSAVVSDPAGAWNCCELRARH